MDLISMIGRTRKSVVSAVASMSLALVALLTISAGDGQRGESESGI